MSKVGGKNIIILMIDGGRLDRAKKSPIFNKLKEKGVFFSQSITYGPHTIAAMHAVFSGTYGNRTGTNSYWSTYKFKKEKFKTLTEYLHDENYFTMADVVNKLVIPKQGFDKFLIHDELNDNLTLRHCDFLTDMKKIESDGKNFFLYLKQYPRFYLLHNKLAYLEHIFLFVHAVLWSFLFVKCLHNSHSIHF